MTYFNKLKTLEMLLKAPVQRVAGEYTICRRKAATGQLVQQVGPFKNLITNIGLNRFGTGNCDVAFVGTGTATPNVTNTALQAELAQTTTRTGLPTVTRSSGTPYWVSRSVTWRFNAGEATGNISEVGIGWIDYTPSPTSRCFSRALVVDGGGSPVTITVLADEVLDITYTIKYYPPLTDHTQSLSISSVAYTVVTRAAQCTDNNTAVDGALQGFYNYAVTVAGATSPAVVSLGSLTEDLQNVSATASALTSANPYVDNSKTITGVFTCDLEVGNFAGGIQGFSTLTGSDGGAAIGLTYQRYQSTVTPAIPKDATKVLSVGVAYSWDRYTP